jgi:hypothetical protein
VTNRLQAEEVLRISPDTKQNKKKQKLCLVFKANYRLTLMIWAIPSTMEGETQSERARHHQGAYSALTMGEFTGSLMLLQGREDSG